MTAPSIPALLEPIQARLDAAIPGPWEPMRAGLLGTRVVTIDGEWDEGIVPPEFINMVTPAMRNYDTAVFIAASPTDTARLLAAVKAVEALHKPYAICDPCECTDHPEEYEYIDCGEYNGCERTITAWACGECCSDAMWFNTEECATNHRHTMNKDERCPTVSAVEAALRGEA